MADRAGKRYWDAAWGDGAPPRPLDDADPAPARYPRRRLAGAVEALVRGAYRDEGALLSVLEVGCARSAWLPWFATRCGAEVAGLDYSEIGCDQARAVLQDAGIHGRVVCADLFDPPKDLLDRFDVVFTNGVVEHFDDTIGTIRALARLAAPGGRLITLIPNLTGMLGAMQRRLDRSVYDIHVPLDTESLAAAHTAAGLNLASCEYVVALNFGVLNVNGLPRGSLGWVAKKAALAGLARANRLVWRMDATGRLPAGGRRTASYVLCAADRR